MPLATAASARALPTTTAAARLPPPPAIRPATALCRELAEHSVVLDPAYVHITRESMAEVARHKQLLATRGVYSAGRYGSWTYCSIEDNIVEARELAARFNTLRDQGLA